MPNGYELVITETAHRINRTDVNDLDYGVGRTA